MATEHPSQQVVVVADDPIEAGMLALDLVQAGLSAQAVRDGPAALQQLAELDRSRPGAAAVLVAAHRDLAEICALHDRMRDGALRPGFVAVVLRSQRDAAETQSRDRGWSGVAVRPVNAEELVALVAAAHARHRPVSGATVRTGSLADEGLLDLLGRLIDRIPAPGQGKDAEIRLESLGRTGVVAVVDGELVHAACDGDTGRHVLERLCCWRQGTWQVEPVLYQGTHTLTGSSIGLLGVSQEYARRVEEARQNLPYTDCVCTVRWERVRPLPVAAEALFRRIAAGAVLADALPGEGDDELEAYAALETRIKRGAVVPQIETAPHVPTPTDAGRDRTTPDPSRTSGLMQVQSTRGTATISASFRTGGFSAVPMTLVDAPQLPDRRRSHPTTHLYKVGADGKPIEPRDTQAQEAVDASVTDRPPALPPRRQQSGFVSPASASTPGTRKGMVTGWFGVGVGEGTEGDEAPATSASSPHRGRTPTPLAPQPTVRVSQSIERDEGQRLAARPYAWVPAAPRAPEPSEDEAEVAPLPKPRKRWPWLVAALLIAAVATVALWPSAPQVAGPKHDARSYQAAIEMIDKGHDGEALALLRKLVQSGNAVPEALLHLAVLEVEAGQTEAGRAHLEAYLGHREARHLTRARKLYERLFGGGAQAAQSGASGGT